MNDVFFKIISYGSDEYKTSVLLREEVLLKPIGRSYSAEVLERERSNIHIAGFKENEIVSTIVLSPKGDECKMKRVVVKTDLQNFGLGSSTGQLHEKFI